MMGAGCFSCARKATSSDCSSWSMACRLALRASSLARITSTVGACALAVQFGSVGLAEAEADSVGGMGSVEGLGTAEWQAGRKLRELPRKGPREGPARSMDSLPECHIDLCDSSDAEHHDQDEDSAKDYGTWHNGHSCPIGKGTHSARQHSGHAGEKAPGPSRRAGKLLFVRNALLTRLTHDKLHPNTLAALVLV